VRPGKNDHVLDLIVLNMRPSSPFAVAAIVADGGDVFWRLAGRALNQIIRTSAAESTDKSRAVGNVGDHFVESGVEFLFHRALTAAVSVLEVNFAVCACVQPASSCRPGKIMPSRAANPIHRPLHLETGVAANHHLGRAFGFGEMAGKAAAAKVEERGWRSPQNGVVPVPSREGTISNPELAIRGEEFIDVAGLDESRPAGGAAVR